MPDTRATSKGSINRFWDQFIERARKKGIKEAAMRWYVLRAEQYLKAFPDKRLAAHSTEDVTGYLEMVGRIDGISDWQFVQIVDAIQNLLQTAGTPAVERVDWAYWRDSARAAIPEMSVRIGLSLFSKIWRSVGKYRPVRRIRP